MRILCSFYLVKLGNLSNFKIKIKRINSIKLKLNLTITLEILFAILEYKHSFSHTTILQVLQKHKFNNVKSTIKSDFTKIIK